MNPHDVLLAGPPRSGTTLACELLNLVPETVALDEPMRWNVVMGRSGRVPNGEDRRPPDPAHMCDAIDRFLAETRESIATKRRAPSKQVEGRVLGGKLTDGEGPGSVRTRLASLGEIRVEKPLSTDFLLVVKHGGGFTALLESLVERFRVYALIRNPLSLLSSWQTVPFRIGEGHHGIAERIDHHLAESLGHLNDPLDRQFHLLSWFFEKVFDTLPERNVIRYESIVGSGGKALAAITDRASDLDEPLDNRNRAAIYDPAVMRKLGERLLASEGAYWHFYTLEDVERLLEPRVGS